MEMRLRLVAGRYRLPDSTIYTIGAWNRYSKRVPLAGGQGHELQRSH